MSDVACGHSPALEFDTGRLELRQLRESDASLYCELYGDAQIMRFIGPPLSRERALRSFRTTLASMRRHPVERLIFTVTDRAAQQVVGLCGIYRFERQPRRAEVGVVLKPASHAQGFAKECLGFLVAQAFAMFALDEICGRMMAGHYVAERLLIGVGFSPSDEPEQRDGDLGHRLWSVYRESWSHKATAG